MLAAGWRTLHHISFGVYNESRDRETKCRDVPDAGLRRADDGNALADAETRSGAFSASEGEESRRQNSSKRGDWRRSGDGTGGNGADSPRPPRKEGGGRFGARGGGEGG